MDGFDFDAVLDGHSLVNERLLRELVSQECMRHFREQGVLTAQQRSCSAELADAKKRVRMERNRLAAQLSRDRLKRKMEHLEKENESFRVENESLRRANDSLRRANESLRAQNESLGLRVSG